MTSFLLEAGETISFGVRRILNEIVDQILQDLTDLEKKRDEGVHDARKNCKRARAVYRLIRDETGIAIYREENIRFRCHCPENHHGSKARRRIIGECSFRYYARSIICSLRHINIVMIKCFNHSH